MIEGLKIRCNVGPLEVMRSPLIELVNRRRAVVSMATIRVPDPEGEARASLAIGQPVCVRWGYRGEDGLWHDWQGTIEAIDQPKASSASADALTVTAVGEEKKLLTTLVTESFLREPADVVARRLLGRTGLPVRDVEVPGDVLPYQVFSGIPVARCIRQLANTLERSFGHDMHRHAVWLSPSGLVWGSGDTEGDTYSVATAENLRSHTPPATADGVGVLVSVPLPGMTHSMKVHIRDTRRGVDTTVRALDVVHTLGENGNATTITYGKDTGWM